MDDYVRAYCFSVAACGFVQTYIMIKYPPDKTMVAVLFYLVTPILPLILMTTFPIIIYKSIEQVWLTTLRRRRLRVKRY